MRTTLTLADDVAKMIEHLRVEEGRSLKDIVNQALRIGLAELTASPEPPTSSFETREVSLGRCRLADVDDIAEVLAVADGEAYR